MTTTLLKTIIALCIVQFAGISHTDNKVNALESNYFEACWDIELEDENMFCYGAVNWKIDEETYYNQAAQDEKAK